MNCAQFESLIVDIASGRIDAGAAVRTHLSRCAGCRARLQAERRLTAALRDLAAELNAVTAPPAIAPKVLAEIQARRAARPAGPAVQAARRLHALGRWAGASALAAAVMLALGVIFTHATRIDPPVAAAPPAVRQPSPETRPLIATPFYPVYATAARVVAAPHPVAGADPRLAGSRGVVRVRMPRATLAVFGLPFNHRRAMDPISADLLVDTSGAVMALRFVQ